jgi:hypothetical protein
VIVPQVVSEFEEFSVKCSGPSSRCHFLRQVVFVLAVVGPLG